MRTNHSNTFKNGICRGLHETWKKKNGLPPDLSRDGNGEPGSKNTQDNKRHI